MEKILAVDLGVKTGLALFDINGKLLWFRSKNFRNRKILKNVVYKLMKEIPDLKVLVLEGGGDLAELWEKSADKLSILTVKYHAEDWRKRLFYKREYRNTKSAKLNAQKLCKSIIKWSELPLPKNIKHDAAEAILVGVFYFLDNGLLNNFQLQFENRL